MTNFQHILGRFSVGQRLTSVPIVFALGGIGLLVVMSWQSIAANRGAAAINLAGRQRMLNQRHTREVLQTAISDEADFAQTRKLIRESLVLLNDGGEHAFGHISPASEHRLVQSLESQARAMETQFALADRFLEETQEQAGSATALRDELIANTTEVHKAAQDTVKTLSTLNAESQTAATRAGFGLGIVVILVSGVCSFLVGRTIVSEIRSLAERVRKLSGGKLSNTSRVLRSNAESTCDQASMASGAAEQVNQNAQQLSVAVAQFEASIKEIAGNASCAASVARTAVDAASETNDTITRLGDSSSEIGNVIKVINSIAEQTNLLALNATIEAARAGEAGKGFAVVANEVKELAKETSNATENIVKRIEAIQSDTRCAVDAIGQVGEIISQINESQNAIAGAVEEQTAMTSEISRNLSEVATGSGDIADSISRVADAARSTTTESEETLLTACSIEQLATDLLTFVGTADGPTTSDSEQEPVVAIR